MRCGAISGCAALYQSDTGRGLGWVGTLCDGTRNGYAATATWRIGWGVATKGGSLDGVSKTIFWSAFTGDGDLVDIARHSGGGAYDLVGGPANCLGHLPARD